MWISRQSPPKFFFASSQQTSRMLKVSVIFRFSPALSWFLPLNLTPGRNPTTLRWLADIMKFISKFWNFYQCSNNQVCSCVSVFCLVQHPVPSCLPWWSLTPQDRLIPLCRFTHAFGAWTPIKRLVLVYKKCFCSGDCQQRCWRMIFCFPPFFLLCFRFCARKLQCVCEAGKKVEEFHVESPPSSACHPITTVRSWSALCGKFSPLFLGRMCLHLCWHMCDLWSESVVIAEGGG